MSQYVKCLVTANRALRQQFAIVKVDSSTQNRQEESVHELPYPATSCVTAQHLWVHPSRRSWAYLVVGAFYDSEGKELWNTEVFIGRNHNNELAELAASDSRATSPPEFPPSSPSWGSASANPVPAATLPPVFFNTETVVPSAGRYHNMSFQGPRGWNPAAGLDAGGPPPAPQGGPFPAQGPQACCVGGPMYPPAQPYGWPPQHHQQPCYSCMGMPNVQAQYPSATTSLGGQIPLPVFPGQPPRYPNPHPVVNPECPALNLSNSTGGAGCEPGYNYYFPAEHTKVHVIKSTEAPWRLPHGVAMHYGAYHIPAGTTIGELMKGFGATNSTAKKNRITEVIQGGNGRWYKGVTFAGDEKDACKKTLKSLGWDRSRTGRMGEKPVVWIWVTKD